MKTSRASAKRIWRWVGLCLGTVVLSQFGLAAPTHAVSVTWDFYSGSSTPSTSSGTGYGNVHTFTADGIMVTVTAWGLTGSSGTTFQTAAVARTASGLGSCNRGEGASCTGNSQRVDDNSQLEFLLFQFSAPVDLKQIVLHPGGTSFDRDVSYWVGNLSASLNGLGLSGLAGLGFGSRQDVLNSAGSAALTLSLTGSDVTSLLFGARAALSPSTAEDDRFYIRSLTDDLPTPVAEPGTLIVLGAALLAMGLGIRQRASSGIRS